MALDFTGIPEHAERKDSVSVRVTPESPMPFSSPLTYEGDRIYIDHGFYGGRFEVTDAYEAWVRRQPRVHSVTFTWTEPPLDQETTTA